MPPRGNPSAVTPPPPPTIPPDLAPTGVDSLLGGADDRLTCTGTGPKPLSPLSPLSTGLFFPLLLPLPGLGDTVGRSGSFPKIRSRARRYSSSRSDSVFWALVLGPGDFLLGPPGSRRRILT